MVKEASARPDVSILVVAYQSAEVIGACLGSIAAACARYSHEVLLVDNGDGSTAALVAEAFPEVQIVPGRGNIGFAAGNNLLAQSACAPFLLLANPDLEMRAGAIDALLDAAARYPQAAAWGGVTLDRSGRPDIGNSVHVPSLKEMVSRLMGRSITRVDGDAEFTQDERVAALSGGFVMVSRAAWDKAGGLDESYFLYCEEVDLFYRLGRMGYDFWRIGAARAFHDAGHGHDFSPMRLLYRAAGTMQFMRLHRSPGEQLLGFALIWLGAFQRYLGGLVLGGWKPRLRKVGQGYRQVTLYPQDWRHGYDPARGLLARLKQRQR